MTTPNEQTSPTKTFGRTVHKMISNDDSSASSSSGSQSSFSISSDSKPIEKFSTDLSKLPEVPQIDGFKRGYEVETLLDIFENNFGEQYLYIKFKNLFEPELVPLNLAVKNVGHLLPRFYKDYLKAWNKWQQNQEKERN